MMDDAFKLHLLWEKLALDQLMLGFGRALDLHDWPAYRACFADEFTVDFSDLLARPACRVRADTWTAFARAALEPVRCLHRYTNHVVSVRGEQATSVLYMEANHFRPGEGGGAEYTQHGWYENSFTRVEGRWRISVLRQRIAWCRGSESVLALDRPEVGAALEAVFTANDARQSER